MAKTIGGYLAACIVGYALYLFVLSIIPYTLPAMGCGFAVAHVLLNKFGL